MSAAAENQSARRSIGERFNFRMLCIVTIFTLLIGVPVYSFVKIQLNHGIDKQGDVYHVDLKLLGYFPFDEISGTLNDIPAQYRKLDGKEVALEGYVYSTNSSGKVSNFEFVYSIQKCCFGGPPLVQERVFAKVNDESIDPVCGEEIRIIGTLHISAEKDEVGKIEKLYTMDVERVEPL